MLSCRTLRRHSGEGETIQLHFAIFYSPYNQLLTFSILPNFAVLLAQFWRSTKGLQFFFIQLLTSLFHIIFLVHFANNIAAIRTVF